MRLGRPAWEMLPAVLRDRIRDAAPEAELFEIRLRAERKMQLAGRSEDRMCGEPLTRRQLAQIVSALMEHSLYAWEDELARGYFTTRQGFRVGVAGKYRMLDGELRLQDICSLCIRLAHAAPGCADRLMKYLVEGRACLILSPPGCGKTTLLRDAARQLSNGGRTVAVLDERCEIAAAWQGLPSMDVGERTDVVEGIGKSRGIPMIVRALSPQILVTDELGGLEDAAAVADELCCGVQMIATAHAGSLEDAQGRQAIAPLLERGFDMVVQLGMPPGSIRAIRLKRGDSWVDEPTEQSMSGDDGKGGEHL